MAELLEGTAPFELIDGGNVAFWSWSGKMVGVFMVWLTMASILLIWSWVDRGWRLGGRGIVRSLRVRVAVIVIFGESGGVLMSSVDIIRVCGVKGGLGVVGGWRSMEIVCWMLFVSKSR